ncbi:hypothetical protein Syun_004665 [Stephania yunnanensis]|uniref:Uncharacterized protein n=1 Tax=Stephania yunnanensis TaxID=152371 RepID=A0AAP0Q1H3_9MAGN
MTGRPCATPDAMMLIEQILQVPSLSSALQCARFPHKRAQYCRRPGRYWVKEGHFVTNAST